MAYYLQRIRIGSISREMADLSWAWETEDVVVDDIHRIDASFDDYFRQLPDFLRIDKAFGQHRESMAQQGPHIRLQSYVVNLIANAKRCKFHLVTPSRALLRRL